MDSVLVLIAAPGSRAIGSGLASLAQRLTEAEPRWLAAEEAVEFHISSSWRKPGPNSPREDSSTPVARQAWVPAFAGMTELRGAFAGQPIDIALLPAANRRKRLLVADMDSTLIHQECIDELGALTACGDRIRDITFRAMRGELDFSASLRERVALMKGLPRTAIADILERRISFVPGGETLVATMRANGAYAALVSGGFTQFTEHVAQRLGFDEHRANELIFEGEGFAGTVREPVLGKDAKVDALHALAVRLGLTPEDAMAVGDGANDIPMLQLAGLGVAMHAKPAVREAARVAIDHGDLTALLYLQGYGIDQFVRREALSSSSA